MKVIRWQQNGCVFDDAFRQLLIPRLPSRRFVVPEPRRSSHRMDRARERATKSEIPRDYGYLDVFVGGILVQVRRVGSTVLGEKRHGFLTVKSYLELFLRFSRHGFQTKSTCR